MQGRIDNINAAVLRGWGWDPSSPEKRLTGRIFADDAMVGTISLDQARGDLVAAGIGDGQHGFRFPLPVGLQDGQSHSFRLEVDGDTGPVTLHARQLDVAQLDITGKFERIAGAICQGWALDNRNLDRHLVVEILADDALLVEAHALHLRKDLQRLGLGDGRFGFHMRLPQAFLAKARPGQVIVARVKGQNGESPKQIGSLLLPSQELVKTLVTRGRHAQQQGQRADAIALFEDALKHDAGNVESLWRLARLLVSEKGDKVRARALAEKADRLKPAIAEVNLLLARLSQEDEQYEEALSRWVQVSPQNSAYRESLIKAGRCLNRLRRPVEAIRPARAALARDPGDMDALRLLADSYTLVGAPQLALPYWRTLSGLQPHDRQVQGRLAQAQASISVGVQPEAPDPLAVLQNPALHRWTATAAGSVSRSTKLADGVLLRPRAVGEAVSFRVAKPQEMKPGGLPHFGLLLSTEGSGFELEHLLDPQKSDLLRKGLRISFEAEAPLDAERVRLELRLSQAGCVAGSRMLWEGQTSNGPQLAWCDLRLNPSEEELLLSNRLALVLCVAGRATLLWNPPRPTRLLHAKCIAPLTEDGSASPELLKQLPLGKVPRFHNVSAPDAEVTWSMAYPFTTVVLWDDKGLWNHDAVDRSLNALLAPLNLPMVFRIAVSPATVDLAAAWMATRPADPRVGLAPAWLPSDETADWIIFLKAGTVPEMHHLRSLHDEACLRNLEQSGDESAMLVRREALEAGRGWDPIRELRVGGSLAQARRARPWLT